MQQLSPMHYNLSFMFHTNTTVSSIINFFLGHKFSERSTCDGHHHLTIKHSRSVQTDLSKYVDVINCLDDSIFSNTPINWDEIAVDSIFSKNIYRLTADLKRDQLINEVISHYRCMRNIMFLLMLVGILAAVIHISIRRVVGMFVIGYLIWTLCCLSLFTTAGLIIKEWKRKKYVKTWSHQS